jgi:hypothetical protein
MHKNFASQKFYFIIKTKKNNYSSQLVSINYSNSKVRSETKISLRLGMSNSEYAGAFFSKAYESGHSSPLSLGKPSEAFLRQFSRQPTID